MMEYAEFCHYVSEKATRMGKPSTRTIAILALPGVQLLDVAGPLDVFAEANAQAGRQAYRLLVFADTPGAIVSSSGTRLMPDRVIGDPGTEPIHTLLVAGCPNAPETALNAAVTDWLRARKKAPLQTDP
jgi:transcriptional regulator GlxA family with amidase domain